MAFWTVWLSLPNIGSSARTSVLKISFPLSEVVLSGGTNVRMWSQKSYQVSHSNINGAKRK